MIHSSLFASKSSVWDPKHIRELLYIPEDQLNQLRNIPVWSKGVLNNQDKAESYSQNSQCFGLESQVSSTKSKEQGICLESNSVSFKQDSLCQSFVVSKLRRNKCKSLPNLAKLGENLCNIKSSKSLSIPNIFENVSKSSSNKIATNIKKMEVVTQLDVNVSTHVKKGVTDFEIIQEKHEENKEVTENADENGNNSEAAQDKLSTQREESNSSCDKMEVDSPVKETVTNVNSFSNGNENGNKLVQDAHSIERDEINPSSVSDDKRDEKSTDVKETVSNVDEADTRNINKDNEVVKLNVSVPCDKMESDTSNAESFQYEKEQPSQINEEKANDRIEVNAVILTCDKKDLDTNVKEAVISNVSSNDKIGVDEQKLKEVAKVHNSQPTSALISCDKIESDFATLKEPVVENIDASKHMQNMDKKHEIDNQNQESSINIVPEEQLAEKIVKKSTAQEANEDLRNICPTEKPVTNMPSQVSAALNVPNKESVEKTVGKKRKLETKHKISKKRKSYDKHGKDDDKNRNAEGIHYSLEQIEILLDVMKAFL